MLRLEGNARFKETPTNEDVPWLPVEQVHLCQRIQYRLDRFLRQARLRHQRVDGGGISGLDSVQGVFKSAPFGPRVGSWRHQFASHRDSGATGVPCRDFIGVSNLD